MRYSMSEKKALKKLDIPDFRHMTKDKIVEFASMLPDMDPEVAIKALEQFPEFKDMAVEIVNSLRQTVEKGFDANTHSQDQFFDFCNRTLDVLYEELQKDNLTPEQESDIRYNIMQLVQVMADKDTENKHFILQVIGKVALSLGSIALVASTLLGNKTKTKGD